MKISKKSLRKEAGGALVDQTLVIFFVALVSAAILTNLGWQLLFSFQNSADQVRLSDGGTYEGTGLCDPTVSICVDLTDPSASGTTILSGPQ